MSGTNGVNSANGANGANGTSEGTRTGSARANDGPDAGTTGTKRPGPPARRSRIRPADLGLWLCVAFLALVLTAVLAPSLLAPGDPIAADSGAVLLAPSADHPLGTDASGRDVYTRIVHGARASLVVGVTATLAALVVGLCIGLIAGAGARPVDTVIARGTDVLLAFPSLLVALAIVAVFGAGIQQVTLGIAIGMIPLYVRMGRVQAKLVRRSGYMTAARVLGVPAWRAALVHMLPNMAGPLVLMAMIGFGSAVSAAAGLSFLGLGLQPPEPEWGLIIGEGRNRLADAWWVSTFAGLALIATVVAVTVVGRRLQLRWDRGRS